MITLEQLRTATDIAVTDRHGTPCGSIAEVYVDEQDTPRWIVIREPSTGGTSGAAMVAPLEGAEMRSDALMLACSMDQITSAPKVTADAMTEDDERTLQRHFHLEGADVDAGDVAHLHRMN